VLTKDAWNRIPAELRPALLKAAQETGLKLRAEMRASDTQDIQAMRQNGLKLVALDGRTLDLWRKMIDTLTGKIRGQYAPAGAYDQAVKFRDDYRRQNRAPGR
jgi:TRAP-type C4-dicarboxylate transport system substrate-binding protein